MYGTLISTQTLATTAASVTFSSIPATYTDLVLVYSGRSSTTNAYITIAFNGDSSSSMRELTGSGTAAASYGPATTANGGWISISTGTTNTFASVNCYIPNYTSTANKAYSVDSVTENNAAAATQRIMAGLWSGTTAVTSIALTAGTSFTAGSMFSLYGLTHF